MNTTRYNPKYASYINPDKKAPIETVNKIFLKASTGKYFDIQTAILQERSMLNLVDYSNKTIIHHILLNNDLSKNDKYNLVKSCIDLGAPFDIPDSNGVRPLHIASGQQNRKLVQLLLSKKAEINSKTSLHLTPLHYSVMPETTTCSNKKTLIPDKSFPIEFKTNELFNELFEMFKTDDVIIRYVTHLSSIFKNRFVYDVEEDLTEINKLIRDTVGDKSDLQTKLIEFKNSLVSKTRNRLSQTHSMIDIKENTSDGWAPLYDGIKNDLNAILPFANLRYVYNSIYEAYVKSTLSHVNNVNAQLKKVQNRVNSIGTLLSAIDGFMYDMTNIYNFMKIESFASVLKAKYGADRYNKLIINLNKLLFVDSHVKEPTIPEPMFNNKTNFDNINVGSSKLGKANKLQFNSFDIIAGTEKIGTGLGTVLELYLSAMNALVDAINKIISTVSTDVLNGTRMKYQWESFTNMCTIQVLLSNICYILIHFDKYARILGESLNKFRSIIGEHNLAEIITLISSIINESIDPKKGTFISLIDYKSSADSEEIRDDVRMFIKDGFTIFIVPDNDDDNKFFLFGSQKFPTDVMLPGWYFGEIMDDGTNFFSIYSNKNVAQYVEKIDTSNINDKLGKLSEDCAGNNNKTINIYDSISALQINVNSLIDSYNSMSGFTFTDIFNNRMRDDTYNIKHTDNFENQLMTKMQQFKLFPLTYRQFFDTYAPMLFKGSYKSANALKTVKSIINTYSVKLSDQNSMFIVASPRPTESFTANYVPQINGIVTSFLTADSSVAVGSDSDSIKTGGQSSRYVGKYALDDKAYDLKKELSIVGSVYDTHIYMIKLIIIMYIVQKVADIYSSGSKGTLTSKLYEAMYDVYSQLNEMSSSNPLGILFAIIAKMTDSIYLSTLSTISSNSASSYIKYLTHNIEGSDIDVKLLITKPDDRVTIRDKEILLSVVSSGIANPIFSKGDASMLGLFGLDQDTNSTDTERIINFDSVTVIDDVCYKIDERVVEELLNAGADPNIVSRSGETPLLLAILLQNENITDLLLRSGSRSGLKSGSGSNVYERCFEQFLNSIESSPFNEIDDINSRLRDHLEKKSGVKMTFSNSKLIMGMVGYLFNHQLTLIISSYPNMWNKTDHSQIINMVNLKHVNYDLLPLAKVDSTIIESIQGYSTFNDVLNEYSVKLTKEREILIRLENSINSLESELTDYSGTSSGTDSYRVSEINELLKETKLEKTRIMSNITSITDTIKDMLSKDKLNKDEIDSTKSSIKHSNTLHKLISSIKNKKSLDVCNVYDVFFKQIVSSGRDVLNSEYTTYLKMWADLLSKSGDSSYSDQTQLVSAVTNLIVNNGKIEPSIFVSSYTPIINLYDRVLSKYGRDLLELVPYLSKDGETYYEYNYVLKQIYCIMHHVFSHTLSINFVNTVAQLLARKDRGRSDEVIMKQVYQVLKSSGFIEYCISTLPKLVIKIVCKISETEKDPDLSLTVTDVLNKALDKLLLSSFDGINKNIIEQTKETLVPFFVTYMETYTAEMHQFMIKQCKLLIVQAKLLRLLNMLAIKAVNESN